MQKKLLVVFLASILLLAGCGINNDTPMSAAKTFMQACIDGDSKLMNKINKSHALMYPSKHVLQMASEYQLHKCDLSDFKFEKKKNNIVFVSNEEINLDWKLKFTKQDGSWYFINMPY